MERRSNGWQRPIIGLAAVVAVGMFGCDTPSTTVTDDAMSQTETLADPYGGYNTADEVAGFDDAFLLEQGERLAGDPALEDSDVQAALADAEHELYGVRVTWGYHDRGVMDSVEPVRWDGSAQVTFGVIAAMRTILFERRTDHLMFPRPDRQTLEWESVTTTHFDGLQLLIVDENEDVDNMLTLTFPQLSKTYSMAELVELDEMIVVDELGHQIHVQARKLENVLTPCHAGWLSGLWQPLPDVATDVATGIRGRFRGHWTDERGDLGGYLKGHYGINTRGHRVFFGKAITMDGRFAGLVRGVWAPSEETPGAGAFRGRWLNAAHDAIGGLRGVYQTTRDGGTFHGAWATGCPEEESDAPELTIDDSVF